MHTFTHTLTQNRKFIIEPQDSKPLVFYTSSYKRSDHVSILDQSWLHALLMYNTYPMCCLLIFGMVQLVVGVSLWRTCDFIRSEANEHKMGSSAENDGEKNHLVSGTETSLLIVCIVCEVCNCLLEIRHTHWKVMSTDVCFGTMYHMTKEVKIYFVFVGCKYRKKKEIWQWELM